MNDGRALTDRYPSSGDRVFRPATLCTVSGTYESIEVTPSALNGSDLHHLIWCCGCRAHERRLDLYEMYPCRAHREGVRNILLCAVLSELALQRLSEAS